MGSLSTPSTFAYNAPTESFAQRATSCASPVTGCRTNTVSDMTDVPGETFTLWACVTNGGVARAERLLLQPNFGRSWADGTQMKVSTEDTMHHQGWDFLTTTLCKNPLYIIASPVSAPRTSVG
eukprot:TRINITY_DN254_c0_g5_i1.p1 TRINITY_DN254_c0_g5~~TRINITY_DN254_c0_g5_i1.p1  ORF type:complete len:140 (-),score=7.27 TRINITY_DN254_c0_g5_i1:1576-1944(-)